MSCLDFSNKQDCICGQIYSKAIGIVFCNWRCSERSKTPPEMCLEIRSSGAERFHGWWKSNIYDSFALLIAYWPNFQLMYFCAISFPHTTDYFCAAAYPWFGGVLVPPKMFHVSCLCRITGFGTVTLRCIHSFGDSIINIPRIKLFVQSETWCIKFIQSKDKEREEDMVGTMWQVWNFYSYRTNWK